MVPTTQIPGVYHRRIGDIVVTALSDGYLDGAVEVMQNITPADATQMLTDKFRAAHAPSPPPRPGNGAGRCSAVRQRWCPGQVAGAW